MESHQSSNFEISIKALNPSSDLVLGPFTELSLGPEQPPPHTCKYYRALSRTPIRPLSWEHQAKFLPFSGGVASVLYLLP